MAYPNQQMWYDSGNLGLSRDPIKDQFDYVRGMVYGPNKNSTPSPSSNSSGNPLGLPTSQPNPGVQVPTWARVVAPWTNLIHGRGSNPANPTVGSLAVEPIEGDSLTQYIRSLTNYAGAKGEQEINTGDQLLGWGADIAGLGLGTTGWGLSQFEKPIDYWKQILEGDPQRMTQTVAAMPELRQLHQASEGAMRGAETTMARGGYRSSTLANQPFEKSGKIADLYTNLRPTAANQLTSIGTTIGGLGLGQQQVGLGQQQIGLGQQGLGQTMLLQALAGLLTRRGQNNEENAATMKMIADLASGIGQMYAAYKYGNG